MKSVLFCRVSSREQEEVGYSLPSQQKLLSEYSDRKGFVIDKTFAISESASGKHQRKTFIEMMKYVEKRNIRIIICEKTDRLTRNLGDLIGIYNWLEQDLDRQLHLVKDGLILHKNSKSQEKFNLDIKVVMAKNYIDNLSEEVKKGQKEKIEQGWSPSKPRLGYKNEDINGHKTHVIDENYAPIIRKMFELYDSGNYSVERLTDYLYSQGLRSRGGNKIVTGRIHGFLTDPTYTGMILWNDNLFQGKHEPLISKELFDRVQTRLHSKTTPKVQKHLFLFKGLVKCQTCSGTISFETHKGITYGHCNHYRPCNDKIWVREDSLESQIKKALVKLQINNKRIMEWIKKALKESNQDISNYNDLLVEQLGKKLISVNKRLSNLYDDKVDEVITKDFYNQKFKEYSKEKTDIEDSIQKHNKANDKFQNLSIQFYELSQRAEQIFTNPLMNMDKKRILLQLIYSKFSLDKGKLLFEYTKGFLILSKLVELTNKSSKVQKYDKNEVATFELSRSTVPISYTPNFAFLDPIVRKGRDLNPREHCCSRG